MGLEYTLSEAYSVHHVDGTALRRDSHVVSRASTRFALSMTALFAGQRETQLNMETNDACLFPSLLDGVQALTMG